MKIPILRAIALVTGLAGMTTFNAQADLEVGATVDIHATADFDTPLAPDGQWVNVSSYGHCWRPANVAVDWQPYENGQWVWTDCGWYWQSDEPWAWACYHYGYWVDDATYGWVWIPGVQWAPAWVCWRIGGGYVGWAPLSPPGFFDHRPNDTEFVFVDNDHFTGHIGPSVVVRNDRNLISRTKFYTSDRHVNRNFGHGSQRVVINDGPGLDAFQKATGKKFGAVSISTAVERTRAPASFQHPATDIGNRHTSASTTPADNRRLPQSQEIDRARQNNVPQANPGSSDERNSGNSYDRNRAPSRENENSSRPQHNEMFSSPPDNHQSSPSREENAKPNNPPQAGPGNSSQPRVQEPPSGAVQHGQANPSSHQKEGNNHPQESGQGQGEHQDHDHDHHDQDH